MDCRTGQNLCSAIRSGKILTKEAHLSAAAELIKHPENHKHRPERSVQEFELKLVEEK